MPLLNKGNKKEISAIEDLIEAKVFVNEQRASELQKLKEQFWAPDAVLPGADSDESIVLLCINLSPAVEDTLRLLKGYELQVETIAEDKTDPNHKADKKRLLKWFAGKKLEEARVAAVIHDLRSTDDELSPMDGRITALSLLSRLPVIALASASPAPLQAAAAATGGTWPVFFASHAEDCRPLCRWLTEELPRVRAFSAAVESDLQSRVAHLGKVNLPWHFLSRGAVALVPFGVMTVNFLGIVRLMANIMGCVGMRGDTSANKAMGMLGAKNAALVTAVDSLGDVYSFAVFATVLADLQGMGLVEAAEALDVVDGLTLGSIGLVTGAVSAIGAALSRPTVVRAAAGFLASLQTIHTLNPGMRREGEKRGGKDKKGKGKEGGKKGKGGKKGEWQGEEAQPLLLRASEVEGAGAGGEAGKGRKAAKGGKAAAEAAAGAGRSSAAAREAAAGAALAAAAAAGGADHDLSGGSSDEDEEESSSEVASELSDLIDEEAEGPESAGPSVSSSAAAASGAPGGGAKLTKEEKAAAVAARKAAAAEAKAAARAAKVAVKEEKTAARAAEKQQRAEAKAAAAASKAEAKAAAAAAKAAAKDAAKEAKAAKKAEAKEAKLAAREAKAAVKSAAGSAASAPAVTSAAVPGVFRDVEGPPGRTAVSELVVMPGDRVSGGSGSRLSSITGSDAAEPSGSGEEGEAAAGPRASGDGGGGEEGAAGLLAAAVARDERMGLDEQTQLALLQFLSLEDEQVYDGAYEGVSYSDVVPRGGP